MKTSNYENQLNDRCIVQEKAETRFTPSVNVFDPDNLPW